MIESDQPVGVLSGHRRTGVGAVDGSDHLEEMIPPVNTWDKEFIVTAIVFRFSYDYLILLAGEFMRGEAVAGKFMSGEAVAGEFMRGEAVAGEFMRGEAVAGEFMRGEAVAGEFMRGEAVA